MSYPYQYLFFEVEDFGSNLSYVVNAEYVYV